MSRKFDNLFKRVIGERNLKRVRLRTDPAKIKSHTNFAAIDGYEGYVLREVGTDVKLYIDHLVENPLIVMVPQSALYPVEDDLEQVKDIAIQFLCKLNRLTPQIKEQLCLARSIDEVDAFLRGSGLTTEEISDIFKQSIRSNPMCITQEGLGSAAKKTLGAIKKGAIELADTPWKLDRLNKAAQQFAKEGPKKSISSRQRSKTNNRDRGNISDIDKQAVQSGTAVISTNDKNINIENVSDTVIYFRNMKTGARYRARYNEFKTVRGDPDIVFYKLATKPQIINKGF